MCNLNLIMRQHETNPNQETVYRNNWSVLFKSVWRPWKTEETEELSQDEEDQMQGEILEQKKDISGEIDKT